MKKSDPLKSQSKFQILKGLHVKFCESYQRLSKKTLNCYNLNSHSNKIMIYLLEYNMIPGSDTVQAGRRLIWATYVEIIA